MIAEWAEKGRMTLKEGDKKNVMIVEWAEKGRVILKGGDKKSFDSGISG